MKNFNNVSNFLSFIGSTAISFCIFCVNIVSVREEMGSNIERIRPVFMSFNYFFVLFTGRCCELFVPLVSLIVVLFCVKASKQCRSGLCEIILTAD